MYSEQFAAAVAAALCVVAIGVVLLCVPDSTKVPVKVADDYSVLYVHHCNVALLALSLPLYIYADSGTILNLRAIFSLLTIPTVAFVVLVKTVAGIPAGVFHAMFTIINIDRLELTPEVNGQLLSYMGFLNMVCAVMATGV